MKILSILSLSVTALSSERNDAAATEYCHSGCEPADQLPNGGCNDGMYGDPTDCNGYFLCWDNGRYGEKFVCTPGLVWNQRVLNCDWPYNLPEDDPCYSPWR